MEIAPREIDADLLNAFREKVETLNGVQVEPFEKSKSVTFYVEMDEDGYGVVTFITFNQQSAEANGFHWTIDIEWDEVHQQYRIPELNYHFSYQRGNGHWAIANMARQMNLSFSETFDYINLALEKTGIPKISIEGTPLEYYIREEKEDAALLKEAKAIRAQATEQTESTQ